MCVCVCGECVCVCVCVWCVCMCDVWYVPEMTSLLSQAERSQLEDDEDTGYQVLEESQADHAMETSAYYNSSNRISEVSKLRASSVCVWGGGDICSPALPHHMHTHVHSCTQCASHSQHNVVLLYFLC